MTDDDSIRADNPAARVAPAGVAVRLVFALGFVAVLALQWELVDWITPFLLFPLLGLMGALYVAALGWELVLLFRAGFRRKTALSAVVVLICGVAAYTVPFTDLWLQWNFDHYEADRANVVAMVKNRVIVPNVSHNKRLIALPPDAPSVSMGGNEIVVETHDGGTYVFFFTYRGILDNYSGFLYVPPGGDPRRFMDLDEETTQFVPMRGRWVYAAHW